MDIEIYFRILLGQLPMLVACAIACIVILGRMPTLGRAGTLGLLGFGGNFLLMLLQPFFTIFIQKQLAQSGNISQVAVIMTMVHGFFSVMHALVVILLLTAILIRQPSPHQTYG